MAVARLNLSSFSDSNPKNKNKKYKLNRKFQNCKNIFHLPVKVTNFHSPLQKYLRRPKHQAETH